MTRHVAGTSPYAWPYDGRLDPGHLALVLAGWDASWRSRCADPDGAAERVDALIDAVSRVGGLVVAVAHLGAGAIAVGDALPVDAAPPSAVATVDAVGLDGFHAGPLDALLRGRGRTHLLVCGHGIEGPVHSTLRSANDRGYECLLVTDACTSLTDDLAAAAAHTVTMSGGIFGAVGTTGAVLDALAAPPDPTPDPEA